MSNSTPVATAGAPAAIGPYSQGIATGNLVFLSGQIPLDPATQELMPGAIEAQARQVFRNLAAVAAAAGGSLADVVKLTLFLTDLADFQTVNGVMAECFTAPYPAPSIAPMNSEGAKTPPEPPMPIVRLVATILPARRRRRKPTA